MGRFHLPNRAWCLGFSLAMCTAAPVMSNQIRGFSEHFLAAPTQGWHIANYRFSHPAFDTDWSHANLRFEHGLHLSLTPQTGAENRFVGASVRRDTRSHYGRYEAMLHPAKGAGIVTGFFTYTGPHYGTQHDEIDIEFLGQDTTRMQIAWFVDGVLHSRQIPLGFDAADRPRAYAFDWHPDRLRWYADGKLVFEVTEDDTPLPKEPGYLFANLWAADKSVQNWAGLALDGASATAYVGHMSFTPLQTLSAGLKPETPTP